MRKLSDDRIRKAIGSSRAGKLRRVVEVRGPVIRGDDGSLTQEITPLSGSDAQEEEFSSRPAGVDRCRSPRPPGG